MVGNVHFVEAAEEVEVNAGQDAVFEFRVGEAVPLPEQNGFEHGEVGVGGTAAVVADVAGFVFVEVCFYRLPVDDGIKLQEGETVDVFGDYGLGGLLEEGVHGKSPKFGLVGI